MVGVVHLFVFFSVFFTTTYSRRDKRSDMFPDKVAKVVPLTDRIDHRITNELLLNYKPSQTPENLSDFFKLHYDHVLLQRFNTETNVFTIGFGLFLVWQDSRLHKDTHHALEMEADKIWMPSVYVQNDFKATNNQPYHFRLGNPTVVTMGLLGIRVSGILSFYCDSDLKEYPFDRQICSVTFHFKGLNYFKIDKTELSDTIPSLDNEWTVESYSFAGKNVTNVDECSYQSHIVVLSINLKRNYQMHVQMYVVPSIILIFLTLSLYWLPHSSNQRFSMGFGVSFGLIILSSFCSRMFPNGLGTSTRLVSCLLYGYVLLFVTFFVSVVTCNLSSKIPSIHPIPLFFQKLLNNRVVSLVTGVSNNNSNNQATIISATTQQQTPKGNVEGVLQVLYQQQQQQLEKKDNEWKRLSRMMDRLFFYFFSFVTLICLPVFYL